MKPPAWRTERAIYPWFCEIQTRYHDEDLLGHVNNIAQAAYFDEARSRFMRRLMTTAEPFERTRIVTADSRVSYLAEVFHPDMIEIGTGILRIGSASFGLGQAMFQKGRCVCLCETIFVQADANGSSPIDPRLRAALEQFILHAPAREGIDAPE